MLIAACEPHDTQTDDDYSNQESFYYPPNLALTSTLEISNYPILNVVRSTLLPALPADHRLTAFRDKLEVLSSGGRLVPQAGRPNDGRLATIVVTLPVRFSGGDIVIRDRAGKVENFYGKGGTGNVEWTAHLADCDYEVETVQKGCRVTLSYAVFGQSPSGITEPLVAPGASFLDLLSPILNLSRGRKIAFYLSNTYGINPSECLAETLLPQASFFFSIVSFILTFHTSIAKGRR